MGQYQQWLHYQEIDRQLRAELARLEAELAHLQESIGDNAPGLESAINGEMPRQFPAISTHNTVIRLLELGTKGPPSTFPEQAGAARNGSAHDILTPARGPADEHGRVDGVGSGEDASGKGRQTQNGEILATPVISQGRLPQFGPAEAVEGTHVRERQARATTPDTEIVLLPQDMQVFFDQHAQTDPQQEVPWWLRKKAANTVAFDDSESLRTDELVRRWIERRKQLAAQATQEEDSVTSEEGAGDE
ncbi:MAG TPA: hypothetical protein VKV20_01215 [Ktedonobacteraceae bacterium]|jgi:hypothetical protein|nr:hypothetical protein [Ktedonobacteraceae bacterium]